MNLSVQTAEEDTWQEVTLRNWNKRKSNQKTQAASRMER